MLLSSMARYMDVCCIQPTSTNVPAYSLQDGVYIAGLRHFTVRSAVLLVKSADVDCVVSAEQHYQFVNLKSAQTNGTGTLCDTALP